MRFADGDHVIQQFATTTAAEPLGNPILPTVVWTAVIFMERTTAGTSVPYLAS